MFRRYVWKLRYLFDAENSGDNNPAIRVTCVTIITNTETMTDECLSLGIHGLRFTNIIFASAVMS